MESISPDTASRVRALPPRMHPHDEPSGPQTWVDPGPSDGPDPRRFLALARPAQVRQANAARCGLARPEGLGPPGLEGAPPPLVAGAADLAGRLLGPDGAGLFQGQTFLRRLLDHQGRPRRPRLVPREQRGNRLRGLHRAPG